MIQILQYTCSIVALLYFVGYGVTALFLPRHLRKDILWYIPWTGVALIALYGVILSFAKVPMSTASYIILGISGVSAVYALLMIRFERVSLYETAVLVLGVITCYTLSMIPLFEVGYPTVLSLGNVDPISYTNVADFFVNNTVWQGKEIPPYSPYIWAVGDLVHYSYRWGSAIFLSFFNVILDVRSYQTFSIVLAILFALTFPILVVFAKQLCRRYFFIPALLIFLTFSLNSTIVYMVYHVFFAQFLFIGLYIYILILLITHIDEEYLWDISGPDVLLGILMASVTTLYPEGLVFILVPFAGVTIIRYIFYRNVHGPVFFLKVVLLMIMINPVTSYTAFMQNLRIIFVTSKNTFIGWEMIRHAAPIETLGFYNLFYYRPLPMIIRILSTMGILALAASGVTSIFSIVRNSCRCTRSTVARSDFAFCPIRQGVERFRLPRSQTDIFGTRSTRTPATSSSELLLMRCRRSSASVVNTVI